MSSNPRTRNGNARRKAVAWLRAQGRPCWICEVMGRPPAIDYSLPARHPMSFECDELVPVSRGGSPTDHANLAATHRACNEWRSDHSVSWVMEQARLARGRQRHVINRSRRWL